MKNVIIILALISIACLSGCSNHKLRVSETDRSLGISEAGIIEAVDAVKAGMTVQQMRSLILPLASSPDCFKVMGDGRIKFYYSLGIDSQIWIDVKNPDNLHLPTSPPLPGGIVIHVGPIEKRTKLEFLYEDSTEIK